MKFKTNPIWKTTFIFPMSHSFTFLHSRDAKMSYLFGVFQKIVRNSSLKMFVFLKAPLGSGNKLLFFRSHRAACGILLPQSEIEPVSPAVEVQSPNHWMAREVLQATSFEYVLEGGTANSSEWCGEKRRWRSK